MLNNPINEFINTISNNNKINNNINNNMNFNNNMNYNNMLNNNMINIFPHDERLENLKMQIFKNICLKFQKKQANNYIRKYFYNWLKKAIKLEINEEKEKAKQKEIDYKNKEAQIIDKYEKVITEFKNKKIEDDDLSSKIKKELETSKKELKQMEYELRKSSYIQFKDKSNQKLLLNYKGLNILERAVWRTTCEDPLEVMGNKI